MGPSHFQFDLQQFLADMREEQRQEHKELSERIDKVLVKVQDHETRIVVVESTRKSVRWLAGTVIVAMITAAADFLFVHLPKLFVKP